MKAVVMAAGKGERFWPLTETRPKHLLPIGGIAILERTLSALAGAGVSEILLVVNYKSDMIRAAIADGSKLGCRVEYVEQKKPRGTADALRASAEELEGENCFLVVYGDDYYDETALGRFVRRNLRHSGITIGIAEVEDASRFGKIEIEKGLVTGVNEKMASGAGGKVNAGVYMFDGSVLDAVRKTAKSSRGEFELTDSLRILVRQHFPVHPFLFREGEWLGLTYPWDLLEANRLTMDKMSYSLRGKLEDGVTVKGRVGSGSGCIIKAGSYIEGPVLLGENSVVGPNSYLRPYACIGNDVKVGSACEVKNSLLMDGARVPHLSYLGDSVIGYGCSLGAGTITANLRFDEGPVRSAARGAWVDTRIKKLGAILGDQVRTGINVSLFPGVKVGAGAWLGPGAVVKTDVPAHTRFKGSFT